MAATKPTTTGKRNTGWWKRPSDKQKANIKQDRRRGDPTPPSKPGSSKPSTTKKSSSGMHKSAIKEVPTKDLYAEIKRRSRTDKGPEKAPRWTPAGGEAHRSRGGTK